MKKYLAITVIAIVLGGYVLRKAEAAIEKISESHVAALTE